MVMCQAETRLPLLGQLSKTNQEVATLYLELVQLGWDGKDNYTHTTRL
jgi:hypothetical protein